MTLSHSELFDRFENGNDDGRASSMALQDIGGGRVAVVGYGHAIYASRNSTNGDIVVFTGWRGRSPGTTKHINKLVPFADWTEDARPRVLTGYELQPNGAPAIEELVA